MYLKVNGKYSSFNSELANNEKNDCFVRALAVAADVDYETAHQTAKEIFGREDKKGTNGFMTFKVFDNARKAGLMIGRKVIKADVLGRVDIKNKYKVKGEVIWRKKTLKSFVESHKTGRYIVTVAGHALAVIEGELQDWGNLAYQPTRKVLSAYRIMPEEVKSNQLTLF